MGEAGIVAAGDQGQQHPAEQRVDGHQAGDSRQGLGAESHPPLFGTPASLFRSDSFFTIYVPLLFLFLTY